MVNALKPSDQFTPPKNHSYNHPENKTDLGDAFESYQNPNPTSESVVTLIKPPIIFSKMSYSTPLTMPLGLGYMAACLEKAKYQVRILDCPGADVENIELAVGGRFKVQGLNEEESIKRIDRRSDIIGVSIMFSQEWPHCRDYINKVRKQFPNATIVVGGEHPTAMPEYSLRDCPAIDYLVAGEGELTFLELVHALRSGKSAIEVGGVHYMKDDVYHRTGLAPRIASIHNMPWPAWHLIDVEAYFHPNFTMGIGHGRNMAMLATRGCPYQCTFCSNPTMWTTRYKMRDVKDVVDELEFNMKKYGANSIDFYDLTAIVKRDWTLDFIQELKSRKITNIVWQLPSGTRSESLDDEVIKGLAETGCEFLVYAPESGSERTLAMIKKRVNLEAMTHSIKTAVDNNVVVKINFIIGFPFETRRDIFKTLWFVWKMALLKADDCNVCTFSPYPGSELFDELNEEGFFGKIDDEYFYNLITQFDFTIAKTVCRNVGFAELFIYRVAGMGIFYILSYLRKISRLGRLIKCMFQKGHFQPRSLFEQRVYDMVARSRQSKAAKVGSPSPA